MGTGQSNRRSFLNWLLGSSFGAFLASAGYPLLRFISPPRIPEASTNELEAGTTNDPELLARGFKIVPFGSEPLILIQDSETSYRAFTATCTHLDCVVEYRQKDRLIWCNCHNGVYDLTGRNVAGPPPRPLTPFRVHVVAQGAGKPALLVVAKT